MHSDWVCMFESNRDGFHVLPYLIPKTPMCMRCPLGANVTQTLISSILACSRPRHSPRLIKEASNREELTKINADPDNWTWTEQARDHWREASNRWKDFADYAQSTTLTETLDLGNLASIRNDLVLVRECYREAEKVVWHQAVESLQGGIIFTGQSGIGKTHFLWYLLFRLLQDNQNVLFIVDLHGPILFYLGSIYALADPCPRHEHLPENSKGGFLWLLFDTPNASTPIPPVVYSSLCFPIQTPSPNRAHFSTWLKHRFPVYTAFPIWSIEELRKGTGSRVRTFQNSLGAILEFVA
ncbi:hypothetical protein F5148DRAFT_918857 [Russula earlei]|uniref:Uncharacterized protein n=1 Tax=Russula earlei TaxID=71964 RepID=A0ACC0UA43_9AGAM|nr:hypothetical protein F5148DRAFT_918857 [Russula earlei]